MNRGVYYKYHYIYIVFPILVSKFIYPTVISMPRIQWLRIELLCPSRTWLTRQGLLYFFELLGIQQFRFDAMLRAGGRMGSAGGTRSILRGRKSRRPSFSSRRKSMILYRRYTILNWFRVLEYINFFFVCNQLTHPLRFYYTGNYLITWYTSSCFPFSSESLFIADSDAYALFFYKRFQIRFTTKFLRSLVLSDWTDHFGVSNHRPFPISTRMRGTGLFCEWFALLRLLNLPGLVAIR